MSLTVRNSDGKTCDITLHDVLYIRNLMVNLFSIFHTVVHSKAAVIYEGKTMQLKPNGLNSETIATMHYAPIQQLFVLDCMVNKPDTCEDK